MLLLRPHRSANFCWVRPRRRRSRRILVARAPLRIVWLLYTAPNQKSSKSLYNLPIHIVAISPHGQISLDKRIGVVYNTAIVDEVEEQFGLFSEALVAPPPAPPAEPLFVAPPIDDPVSFPMPVVATSEPATVPQEQAAFGFATPTAADFSVSTTVLGSRYGFPPFSVFDTRQGAWQARKDLWKRFGVASEEGRSGTVLFKAQSILSRWKSPAAGVSVFDPVLCELIYRWFCPLGGHVLDPFAGGSVRGIVASVLGRNYTGIELREEQVNANRAQATKTGQTGCSWIVGNSGKLETLLPKEWQADFVFSCPPYYDLEKYGAHPEALDAMTADNFSWAYTQIIRLSLQRLKHQRFACFVVSDVRDAEGFYRSLRSETVQAMEFTGAGFYNEIILINPVTTLAFRTSSVFPRSRKVGRCHQYILIFYKGDPKQIPALDPDETEALQRLLAPQNVAVGSAENGQGQIVDEDDRE